MIQDSNVPWFGKISILSQMLLSSPTVLCTTLPSPAPRLHLGQGVRGAWFPGHEMLTEW